MMMSNHCGCHEAAETVAVNGSRNKCVPYETVVKNELGLLTRAGNAFTAAVVYNIAKGDT